MTIRLSETVVTSKEGLVEPLDVSRVSPYHEEELRGLQETHLRFNFPHEYSIRVGMYFHHRAIKVVKKGDTLKFTTFSEDKTPDYILCKPFLWRPNGSPRSTRLEEYDDAQFFVIPKEFSPFQENDKVVYEYVKETEETERHIICRHGKD